MSILWRGGKTARSVVAISSCSFSSFAPGSTASSKKLVRPRVAVVYSSSLVQNGVAGSFIRRIATTSSSWFYFLLIFYGMWLLNQIF
jgi:hypothetical protein